MDIELVDEEIIQQMIADTSADVIPMLIDHYLEESQARLKVLDGAFQGKDASVIEFESHTLGSSSLALGNRVLSNLARKIEHLCAAGKADEALEYHQELLDVAHRSLAALEQRKSLGFVD
ncbi:Hpt domain-containing protein [Vibrio sp. LaRot3]|nr:Hpt domain-containing protein [Vibrio sp. LaRot3]MDA0147605.1 Hpt domain-containing protein [Vibrio sp. LaRot3]